VTRLDPVAGDGDGERLDRFLARRLAISRSQAAQRIADGLVTVGGRGVAKSHVLAAGEQVEVDEPAPIEHHAPPLPPVRYRDEHVLVLSKPPGLVVHPGAGTPTGTLVQALQAEAVPLATGSDPSRPGIVHRLDKDTSGLMVVACSDQAYAGLVAALKRREVERRYLALVEGRLPTPRGRVDAPIGRDPRDRKRFACVPDGKPAVTHWRVVAEGRVDDADVSLVECRLETGRTHQIRVHLSHAGHPVVGDRTYRARRDLPETLGLERFALHAHALSFRHPVGGDPVEVTEPLPEDIAGAVRAAGIEA
jgi:23S rRNA pseudouridine1911/1915/1917 synthase